MFNLKTKSKSRLFAFILCVIILMTTAIFVLSSCGTKTPAQQIKSSVLNLLQEISKNCNDIVKQNSVLSQCFNILESSYKISVPIPPSLYEGLGDSGSLPSEINLINDTKSKALALTTVMNSKNAGIYITDKKAILEYLDTPVSLNFEKGADDLIKWLKANGADDEFINSIFTAEVKEYFKKPYSKLFGSGNSVKVMDSYRDALDQLNMIDDFLSSFTYTEDENKEITLGEKTVNARVIKIETDKDRMYSSVKAIVEKIKNSEFYKNLAGVYDSISGGYSPYTAIFDEFDELTDEDFQVFDTMVLYAYLNGNKICALDVFSGDEKMATISLLGEKYILDHVIIDTIPDGTITEFKGNLVPVDNKIYYKISEQYKNDEGNNYISELKWDLNETSSNNFSFTNGYEVDDGFSESYNFYLAAGSNNSVELSVDLPNSDKLKVNIAKLDAPLSLPENCVDISTIKLSDLTDKFIADFTFGFSGSSDFDYGEDFNFDDYDSESTDFEDFNIDDGFEIN